MSRRLAHQAGKHAATGKSIGALAPVFNAERFTDPAKSNMCGGSDDTMSLRRFQRERHRRLYSACSAGFYTVPCLPPVFPGINDVLQLIARFFEQYAGSRKNGSPSRPVLASVLQTVTQLYVQKKRNFNHAIYNGFTLLLKPSFNSLETI